jgi:hypothetical protein
MLIRTCDRLRANAGRAVPEHSKMLSRKRRRFRAYADNDPPLVVQDLDLPTSFALELRHAENATPNRFEVGGEMTFAPQPRAISADQAEFIIRHGFPPRMSFAAKTLNENEGSAPDENFSPIAQAQEPASASTRRSLASARISITRSLLSPFFFVICDRRIRPG